MGESASRWRLRAAAGFLFIATFIVYLPAMNGEFIWDDDAHVTRPELRSAEGLYRIWFDLGATQQHYPLLHSAFWVQYWLWGENPTGYHVVNVLMHATVATLLMFVLLRLEFSRWAAFLAAGAFALHPVHVESVAWITELKNTLSGVFYLSAMLLYLKFDSLRAARRELAHPLPASPKGGGLKLYFAAMGLFMLGLLTKTVIATLPAALLVIFWWKRGKLSWKRDARPLLPWFAIGAAAGLFTAWVEYEIGGAKGEEYALSAAERFLVAGRVVWFYLGKLVWPVNLTFIYPRWEFDAGAARQWLYPAALLGLLIGLVIIARHSKMVTAEGGQARRWRALLAALLLFVGTLFPVLGFFNVYPFRYSYVADHFQYLASMSVMALGVGAVVKATAGRKVLRGMACGGLVVVLGVLSFRQSGMYADGETLYRTTLARNSGCWMAHNNLAGLLRGRGEPAEAARHYEQALELRPHYANAHSGLGDILRESGRWEEALEHLQAAVRYEPHYPIAHYRLGLVWIELGRAEEAEAAMREALRQQPDFVNAMNHLAVLCEKSGRFEEAIQYLHRSLAIEPNRVDSLINLAYSYVSLGRDEEALAAAQRALAQTRSTGDDQTASQIEVWLEAHGLGTR